MFGAFERLVALRYLAARKGERFVSFNAWFSLIGIALGVATLIIVMSVMNGFRQELLGRILGLNGHLGAYAAEAGRSATSTRWPPASAPCRRRGSDARSSRARCSSPARRAARPAASPAASAPTDLRERDIIARNILRGSLADFEGEDTIVVGTGLASRLRVGVGDRITLVSPQGRATVVGTLPRLRAFRVVALFNVGMNEYDSTFAFMPLEAAQAYFQMPGAATQIEVFVEEPTRVRAATREIQRVLADRPVRILDWQESNNSFFAAVQVERNVMFLILTLIILVAAFNIVTTQTMLVKDKRRDIAILRTMGARRGAVLRVFLMCGAAIGVLGTTAGSLLGLVFCAYIEEIRQFLQWLTSTQLFPAEVYFLAQLPAVVDVSEVTQVIAMSFVLSLLAAMYPAWRAARLDPVEALRNE
jgi:lipoprotein-releasing system permease protein